MNVRIYVQLASGPVGTGGSPFLATSGENRVQPANPLAPHHYYIQQCLLVDTIDMKTPPIHLTVRFISPPPSHLKYLIIASLPLPEK